MRTTRVDGVPGTNRPDSEGEAGSRVIRVGGIHYLNALPLTEYLPQDADMQLILSSHAPSRLAELLREGRLDVALVPAVAYLENPAYRVVPDICISSWGAVQSIRLYHRCPIRDVRRVGLDSRSRTSAMLTRLLFKELWGADPEFVPFDALLADPTALCLPADGGRSRSGLSGSSLSGSGLSGPSLSGSSLSGPSLSGPSLSGPGLSGPSLSGPSLSGPSLSGPSLSGPELSGPGLSGPELSGPELSGPSLSGPSLSGPDGRELDALLLIGDTALSFSTETAWECLDLGTEWTRWTGLPFVYAFWVWRGGACPTGLIDRLREAKATGLARIDEIVLRTRLPLGMDPPASRHYLHRVIGFDFRAPQIEGCLSFFRRLASAGLLAEAPREIAFATEEGSS